MIRKLGIWVVLAAALLAPLSASAAPKKHKHAKPLAESQLQLYYDAFNDEYFEGKLPKGVPVVYDSFVDEDDDFGMVTCAANDQSTCTIRLSPNFSIFSRVTIGTILHEMVHLSFVGTSQVDESIAHGPCFEKRMLQLAEAGAQKGIW